MTSQFKIKVYLQKAKHSRDIYETQIPQKYIFSQIIFKGCICKTKDLSGMAQNRAENLMVQHSTVRAMLC